MMWPLLQTVGDVWYSDAEVGVPEGPSGDFPRNALRIPRILSGSMH